MSLENPYQGIFTISAGYGVYLQTTYKFHDRRIFAGWVYLQDSNRRRGLIRASFNLLTRLSPFRGRFMASAESFHPRLLTLDAHRYPIFNKRDEFRNSTRGFPVLFS